MPAVKTVPEDQGQFHAPAQLGSRGQPVDINIITCSQHKTVQLQLDGRDNGIIPAIHQPGSNIFSFVRGNQDLPFYQQPHLESTDPNIFKFDIVLPEIISISGDFRNVIRQGGGKARVKSNLFIEGDLIALEKSYRRLGNMEQGCADIIF